MQATKLPPFSKQIWMWLFPPLYVVWAVTFIYHSSYIASDGRRYFNLFDDAMISMRYAWNFAHGNGLVWNIGERVEGYTNLLMTLLMSMAAFLLEKRYAVLAVQLTGIFFMLGAAFFAMRIFQTLKVSETFRVLPFMLVLLYYPLNFWSLMGMETGLLSFLLGAGVYASLLYLEKMEVKHLWLMSISFGLAHLTRNESVLFAALAFLYLLPTAWHSKNYFQRFLLAGILYSLFVVGQIAFRYFYYGELVPNTYTLKLVGMTLTDRLQNGWGFIQPYLLETGFIIILALIGVLRKPSRHKTYLFGFFLIAILYQIYVGGDSWNYWRIMSPATPFLLVISTCAMLELFNGMESPAWRSALLSLPLIGLLLADIRFAREILLRDLPYQNDYARAHVEAAIALNELTDKDATIGVYWGGTLPYYLDRYAIDFLGKSDKYIANLPPDMSGQSAGFGMNSIPGHNKHDLNYSIKTLLPTYVEEFDYGTEILSGWAKDHYVRVKFGDAKLYLLKDSPHVHWDKVADFLKW
jgi:hypothetical protein